MGTNYYTVMDEPCEHCGHRSDGLHIGKSSFGWAFSFAPYPDHGLTSWAAWRAYLEKRQIRDEYGDPVSLDELSAMVEAKKHLWTHETAPAEAWGTYARRGSIDPEGYRFSDTADFS